MNHRSASRRPMLWVLTCLVSLSLASVPLSGQALPCVGGVVAGFPCDSVVLMSRLTESELGTSGVSDNWGWTDPMTGIEYAILAAVEGTIFVSLEDPENPVVLGRLPTHTSSTLIRDLKVFENHAYIVADTGGHGLQIFDLTQLRNVVSPPVTFAATNHYAAFGESHNIALNPATGFAYPMLGDTCSGGLHMLDLTDPLNPSFVGCYDDAGGVHDAVCFVYAGPDTEHQGSEICIAADLTGAVAFADVTDKANPVTLAMEFYGTASISHQGWITPDHRYYFHGDEGDEGLGVGTRTYLWDIADLDNPVLLSTYVASTFATDHNMYVNGSFLYQANYKAGLRVLQLGDLSQGEMTEVAFLDTRPGNDDSSFGGAWSVYPFFASGNVIVSDTQQGLFVVQLAVPQALFEDGFESGDVTVWSSAQP